jgi:hypothetical protein
MGVHLRPQVIFSHLQSLSDPIHHLRQVPAKRMVTAELLLQSLPESADPLAGPSGVAIICPLFGNFLLNAHIAINSRTVGYSETV